MSKKIMATGDRLSDLPEPILIHILSMLPDGKEVVRSSVLSQKWRYLWKSVPVALNFSFPEDTYFNFPVSSEMEILDFVNSTTRELHYWSSFEKIKKIDVLINFSVPKIFNEDIDCWVHFATKIAEVEDLSLECLSGYKLPQSAFKNTSLRNLNLQYCKLKPKGFVNVNWSNLVCLTVGFVELTECIMAKVLSGCPNLECLRLDFIWGFDRLEISNAKLKKLILNSFETSGSDVWLEIVAPFIQNLQLVGYSHGICLKYVASLVTAVCEVDFHFDFEKKDKSKKKESNCLKELLHSIAHVKNLVLSPWCIKCMSTLALEDFQYLPSSSRVLKLHTNFEELDLPGICSFIQSSSHVETLVIDWYHQDRGQCGLTTVSSLLQAKYITCAQLNSCELFTDFSPVRTHHSKQPLANQVYYYITVKFKNLYASPTDRLLFVWQATERQSMRRSKYEWEVVKWDEEKEETYYGGAGVFHFTVQLMKSICNCESREVSQSSLPIRVIIFRQIITFV